VFPEDPESDHMGIREQKQPGLFYVGLCLAGGRIRGHQLREIGLLSKKYAAPGLDRVVCTNKQNIIMLNIPAAHLAALEKDLAAYGYTTNPTNFRLGCVSCTGIEFCNLALAETKNRMVLLVEQLEKECGFYQDKIRIHFSGCTSSCGQHQIADLGFRGAQTRVNGVMTECFDLFIGGKLGAGARFNELLKGKILAPDIHKTVGTLLKYYQDKQLPGESFSAFSQRVPKDELKAILV
jgi:ferredoxin-nitrite reductase